MGQLYRADDDSNILLVSIEKGAFKGEKTVLGKTKIVSTPFAVRMNEIQLGHKLFWLQPGDKINFYTKKMYGGGTYIAGIVKNGAVVSESGKIAVLLDIKETNNSVVQLMPMWILLEEMMDCVFILE